MNSGLPKWNYSPPIEDLFANFSHNWNGLMPMTAILFGIIFATWVGSKIVKHVRGESDD
jgi:hypothetical protein